MALTSPPPSSRTLEQRRLAIVCALRRVDQTAPEHRAVSELTDRLAVQDRQLQDLCRTVERLVLRLDRLADEVELLQRQQDGNEIPVSVVPDAEDEPLPRRASVPPY